ncbi:hypothetical protein TSUD_262310 [Trifolium subterraneum]|nr:hypothetical protein TSUD_262310 [Trifolium subterraneum]
MAHHGGVFEESLVQRQEKINDACSSLFQLGFDSNLFTIKNIYEHGFTDKEFLEFIEPLTSIADLETDLEELEHISTYLPFKVSPSQSYICLPPYDFSHFLDFMNGLNGTQGQQTLDDVSTRIKKKNLDKKELTKAEVDLAQVLVDYAASGRLARTNILYEIKELKRRQKEMEMEYVRIEDDLRTKLGPLYEYQEPSINELRIEAYKLYEEDCKSKGIIAIPKHHEMGFKKAMEAFGDIVKVNRHLATYVNDPIRKENIKNHFKGMILRFDSDKTDHSDGKVVYKFASELVSDDEPHLSYSKRARSGKRKDVHRGTTSTKKRKYKRERFNSNFVIKKYYS